MTVTDIGALRASSMFREDWEVYQKIVSGDYMYHSCLYSAVQSYLEPRVQEPFSMLDLGCGDSDYLARMLSNSIKLTQNLVQYTGVDMSEPAITLSHSNMSQVLPQSAAIQHHQQDMLGFVASCKPQGYNVVLASFSVHHLTAQQKQQLLQGIVQVLKPGGCFCLVDVFLDEGESRQQYMERYKKALYGMHDLNAEQRLKVLGHVTDFDYPEEVHTYTEWAKQLDSNGSVRLLCERGRMFKAIVFERACLHSCLDVKV